MKKGRFKALRSIVTAILLVALILPLNASMAKATEDISYDLETLSKAASLYRLQYWEDGFDSTYDLNGDWVIDICDLVLIAKNIGVETSEDLTLDNVDATGLSETQNYWWYNTNSNHEVPTTYLPFDISQYNAMYVGDTSRKVLYLTFDTEYKTNNVGTILDTLKANDVKANFFVISNFIDWNSALLNRMVDEGHQVCNHTDNHLDMTTITSDKAQFQSEVKTVEEKFKSATGKEISKFLRPPYGTYSEKSLKYISSLGYKTVLWSFSYVDYNDNAQPDKETAKKTILDNLHNGAILLLHASSDTNAAILDDVIKEAKAQGYEFELLK